MAQAAIGLAAGFVGHVQAAIGGDGEGEVAVFGAVCADMPVLGGGTTKVVTTIGMGLRPEGAVAAGGDVAGEGDAQPAFAVGLERLHPEDLLIAQHLMGDDLPLAIDKLEILGGRVVEVEVDIAGDHLLAVPAQGIVDE